MKKCSKCEKNKSLEEFYNYSSSKDGKTHHCKECMSKYRKSVKEKSRLYMKNMRKNNNEKVKETRRKSWRNLDPRKKLLQQSKNRAKRKNILHNIDIEDITIPKICPVLKVPFIIGTKGNYQYTHSIDRIDNSKGYVKGNIQVMTMKANNMKNSASKKELIMFAKSILKNYKDDDIVQAILKDMIT